MTPGTSLAVQLRREVGELRLRETRRVFDLTVYVGSLDEPGAARHSFVVRRQDLPVLDDALRTEVVSRLLEDVAGAEAGWVTRQGPPELHDCDLDWLSAADRAFGLHGRTMRSFHAITRYGWRDVRTGESRSWKRLRL